MTIQEYMRQNREPQQPKYKAILFSPDGKDSVMDYEAETIEAVWQRHNDAGSRWCFYPIPFVVTNDGRLIERKRILSAPNGLEHLQGITVRNAQRWIQANQDHISAILS